MCNAWCLDFSEVATQYIRGQQSILEVGSRNVNGSTRSIFEKYSNNYVGVDIFEGPGVDRIADVNNLVDIFGIEKFDIVTSTEMLEHCDDWQNAIFQMASVLRTGGMLLLTTRSPGFELHDYPADYWRFSKDDFLEIFQSIGDILAIEDDMTLGWACGIGILVKKTANQSQLLEWNKKNRYKKIYSMSEDYALAAAVADEKPEESMIFDQYSRYKACSDLIMQTGFTSDNTLLDVGSGPECLLGKFLSSNAITFLDPLIPENSGPNKIKGNIFSDALTGKAFDVVSAVDVLEHVPPEFRKSFLEKISSLARKTIVLGFPTSDTTDAVRTDNAIDGAYARAYRHKYPWLEEHIQFGLPSQHEVIDTLENLGWHCRTIGHGHTPWLEELLGFTICAWDQPALKDLVLKSSQKFNKNLYTSDFQPPHYRQFVIATQNLPATITPPEANPSDADRQFRSLMEETLREFVSRSFENFQGLNSALGQLSTTKSQLEDTLVTNKLLTENLEATVAQRNTAILEHEKAIAILRQMQNSWSWKITRPLRLAMRIMRHGISQQDRQRLKQLLRENYRRLPLPSAARRIVKFVYRALVSRAYLPIKKALINSATFQAPEAILVPNKHNLPDYIIWGVIDWHFRHQRPQQLAMALAKRGRRVFYVSANLIDDNRAGFTIENIDGDGRLFQVKLFCNEAPSIYAGAPGASISNQCKASIGELLNWASSEQLVSLVQHPFWYDIANSLPNNRLVYDCMDHHEGFGNNDESLEKLENLLLSGAEITISTSSWLYEKAIPHTQRQALIRNACDYVHFSERPQAIYTDSSGRKIIGYYGAIAEWFDINLIDAIATSFPECCILLIGADTVNAKSKLSHHSNVQFTGEVSYDKLPYYLYGFDVCLLPFKVLPLTLATNPVKVYEYLAAGKPVVSVELPEMAQFKELVYTAANHVQFIDRVNSVLSQNEPDDLISKRKEFSREQTWQHRAGDLINHVETDEFAPKVSVIVVTYNNLDLTKACLDSLEKYSQYAPMEIIVVDNASSDGSRAYLEEWEKLGVNRKAILNDNNLGFAAANNQGLRTANGDYLVLLNNDTYVTPGWIRTLINHLKKDRSIGIIGPVTNNIGNEAKIDITYSDMEDMICKAANYTNRHIGQTYSIQTAAFFCVMIPRSTYNLVGELDEDFGRGFFEDDDYCRRVEQQGLRIVCADDVFIHHHLSASFNTLKNEERQKLFENNKAIYEAKWGKWVPHNYRRISPGDN